MSRILWLASYPKSGNTWLRMFFTNLRREDAVPASINELDRANIIADRGTFDRLVGFSSEDLTDAEVDLLRPHAYLQLAAQANELLFCKVHDARTVVPNGQSLFPLEASAGAIYLIRNPLDVCVSYAHHSGRNGFDSLIARMANPNNSISENRKGLAGQLRQRLLRWSDHVLSWVDAPGLRLLVLRYEDMQARPIESFTAAAAFAGLTQDPERIARAVAFSSFEALRRQEQEKGFAEQVAPGRSFFRKGKVGAWREVLTSAQAACIIGDHRDVMARFGYLNVAGEPVY
jgi:aryl sulfotransferase